MKQTLSLVHNYKASSLPEKAPVIVMLHGFGSDENDLFSFSSELPSEFAVISIQAPFRLEPYGYAWYNIHFDAPQGKWSDDAQAIESRESVNSILDEIVEKYPVDKDRITLLGFSQGTILSFAVALSYPKKVKCVIGLSGYINEKILVPNYSHNDFRNLRVYASHGSVDQVIPVQWARNTEPFLKNLGIPCQYSEFPVGHGVAPQNFYELKYWLEQNA